MYSYKMLKRCIYILLYYNIYVLGNKLVSLPLIRSLFISRYLDTSKNWSSRFRMETSKWEMWWIQLPTIIVRQFAAIFTLMLHLSSGQTPTMTWGHIMTWSPFATYRIHAFLLRKRKYPRRNTRRYRNQRKARCFCQWRCIIYNILMQPNPVG